MQPVSGIVANLSNPAEALQALMSAVAAEGVARLGRPQEASKFSRQHLANSLWAYATLSLRPSPAFLEAAAAAMRERVAQCNPQEISNTVWAFATIGELCHLPCNHRCDLFLLCTIGMVSHLLCPCGCDYVACQCSSHTDNIIDAPRQH